MYIVNKLLSAIEEKQKQANQIPQNQKNKQTNQKTPQTNRKTRKMCLESI